MNFTCPHCGTPQVVTSDATSTGHVVLHPGESAEMSGFSRSVKIEAQAVRCAAEDCNKLTLGVAGATGYRDADRAYHVVSPLFNLSPYPIRGGKPFPPSVPDFLLEDYREAWSIIDLSPKSSATLARRCLQAAIRDFCGIRERTLFHEIETLKNRLEADDLPKGVEGETIEAMLALKDVGNIGAHMTEVDGIIVDVDPDEAEALLGLIEMLFTDWYVARDKRQEQLARIKSIAAEKKGLPAPNGEAAPDGE